MICVSLGRARHKRMIAEHQHLVEQGAELVELRLDYIGRAVSLDRLLDNRPGPVVVTVRRRDGDGGRWTKSEDERMTLLRSAIVKGIEYVDIEADIAGQIPRYGTTKRIISFHDMNHTPENLPALHARMADEDADIIKIATLANSFDDCVRMMDLVRNATIPTIGICMGEIGTCTRILAHRLGSPFTYATFSKDKKIAPGQLNWRDMTDRYRYGELDADTELFGVIADPVAHSHSPLIHNSAFADDGINACYLPLRIPPDDLNSFINHAPKLGIRGISITIPHKQRALTLCSKAEAAATGIGAINTMIFDGEDRLGYNTDYRAALDCIEEAMGVDKNADRPMQGKTAMVLGAGGVSRAIAWGLRQRNCDVLVASRTAERTEQLAAEIGGQAVLWEDRHKRKIHLLVNGTPVGMHPNVDASPFNAGEINPYMTVFDTVYNPENTLLIKHAKAANAKIVTGVDMFVRQAAYQYKLFTGRDAPTGLMRNQIKQATNPVNLN